MNYEKSGDLRCGRSAVKTVKGFTLIELIIVIAILGILAAISSLAIAGFVRDSKIETANSKAQQAYASLQNLMVDVEIKGKLDPIDVEFIKTGTAASGANVPVSASIEFFMDNGDISEPTIVINNTNASGTKTSAEYDDYKTDTHVKVVTKYLRKTVEDSIAAGFTGYIYADIDVEEYTIESIVYSETSDSAKKAVDASGFVDEYYKTATKKVIRGTKNINVQKDENKKTGSYLGYYPFMEDVSYTLKTDKTPSMPATETDGD